MERGHGNDVVKVTTADPSVGARAGKNIQGIFPGIDWEKGQMRIATFEKILSYDLSRDKELPAIKNVYHLADKTRNVLKCPKCEMILRKSDRYCARCGQKIAVGKYKKGLEQTYS